MSKFKKAIENFFYHYKVHTIFGICLLLFIIAISYALIKGQIENAQERNVAATSLEILLFGDYELDQNNEQVLNNFSALFPESDIAIKIEHTPPGSGLSITTLATERPDIYIFDVHEFDKYVDTGSFYKFDNTFTNQIEDEKLFYSTLNDDGKRDVFGIDISDHAIFNNRNLAHTPKIVVIRNNSDNIAKSLQFIQTLIDKMK